MSILQNSNAISAGGYDINNSLRFRSSATAYLSRTPSSSGNRQKWTWSGWVKRGALSDTMLFHCQISSTDKVQCRIDSNHNIAFLVRIGNVSGLLITSRVLRDPSAWYHIMFVCDTTQATATTQFKIYVNGVEETSFSSSSATTQNGNSAVNSTTSHQIGYDVPNASSAFDGYLAETYLIDGQALTPSSFGETDTTTGVWKPKAYTGTYGTNGFYLKFSDIATTSGSNAGLGKDFSGNGNYWTTNNISVTAGTTYDAMTDSPTLTSATVANYCTLNSTIKISSGSITEGNLKGAGSDFEGWGTIAFPSTGKFYFEYTQNGSTGAGAGPATGIQGINPPDVDYGVHYHKDGRKWVNGTYSSYGATFTTNDIIGVAYDADSNSITFYKNNVSQGAISTTSGYTYLPYQFDNSGNGGYLNFGQRPFSYTPPTGYKALNTYNLPDSTIKKGNSYMDATLYTGNGYPTSGTQSITNAASFKPDLVWIKIRSGAGSNTLTDSVRGVNSQLFSNQTAAQETNTDHVTAFNSNGFSLGTGTSGTYPSTNNNGSTYVGWQWQAGQGSTSSNTSGSITSTVSVNTTAGFSVVTYTGTGSNATVGHGLGVAPRMIIVKQRSGAGQNWAVYHASLANTGGLALNLTNATITASGWWNNTSPTSSVFSLGGSTGSDWFTTNQSGSTYVAYCWAEIAGFSRFGSYTGNGSADGPFIFTGFRPKFIMWKRSSGIANWVILDTSRNTFNLASSRLFPSLSNAETSATDQMDILSNGFKIRVSGATDVGTNGSGDTYIYMAFAENPFKNSLAR